MFRFLPGKYTDSAEWLATPRARLFLQYERRVLTQLLPNLTGYRCVQIGRWGYGHATLAHAGTLCQWQLGFGVDTRADIAFDGRHLPLASASVDALVLAHALEQVAEPHALLRECARVLNARGQLIILAFNPLSLWALRQGFPTRRTPRFRPCSAPPSASRLYDWLRLLEFEPERLVRYGLGFPFFGGYHRVGEDRRSARSIAWCAQAYGLCARRQVAPYTPIRKPLPGPRKRAAVGLARQALHRVNCRR
ncbi:methylase [Salinisphaera sp. C84B14]|uniref:class I SAM-dependent methyltransferase n=1 Tax=Salinisphaera sp. C84B14 TaxID=1304155 RepID=UPI00334177A2